MLKIKNLKQYTCKKVIKAKPMTRYQAQELGLIRDIEATDEKGYYVKYPDGYESWSPKDVFEEGYESTGEPSEIDK